MRAHPDKFLKMEGVTVKKLITEIQTPFYLYSKKILAENVNEFKKHMPQAAICYAVKANSNLAIVRLFAEMGLGADVTSTGEMMLALEAGVPAGKIVFSGVGKTVNGLTAAIENQICQINVESEEELEVINKMAIALKKPVNISLRVNPDVDAKTHKKITTGTAQDKFGLAWPRALAMYKKAAKMKGVRVKGISIHIGSQIMTAKPFDLAFARLASLIEELEKENIILENIDIGGGLGIVYNYKKDKELDIAAYAKLADKHFKKFKKNIIVEPGRRLVGGAGVLISKVLYNKRGEDRNFLIIDAGMNDLIRPAMYDAWHEILPCNTPKGPAKKFDIVGPVCESSDVFARGRVLPPLKRGDAVAVMCAGAYGSSMSSNYNMHPITGEVLAHGNTYTVIRSRKSYKQMLKEQAADIKARP